MPACCGRGQGFKSLAPHARARTRTGTELCAQCATRGLSCLRLPSLPACAHWSIARRCCAPPRARFDRTSARCTLPHTRAFSPRDERPPIIMRRVSTCARIADDISFAALSLARSCIPLAGSDTNDSGGIPPDALTRPSKEYEGDHANERHTRTQRTQRKEGEEM